MLEEVPGAQGGDHPHPNPPPSRGMGPMTRRQFLQAAAAGTAGAVVFTGCVPAREFQAQSRVLLAEDTLTAFEDYYATTCRGCGSGCGTIVRVIEGRAKKVEGNPDHPLNLGKLCARGQGAVQEQYHPDRIQGPVRRTGPRGSGTFVAISWDEALNEVRDRLRQLNQQGRARDVVVLTSPLRGHGAMLVDRFTRAYGGEWRSFELMNEAPLREAVNRVFGSSPLPEFDIQNARYVLSFGADFLGAWLSQVHHSIEYGVFRQGDYRAGQFRPRQASPRGYLVQVEPRMSETAAAADEWVWVRPGTEGTLALSIAQVLLAENLADPAGAQSVGGAGAFGAYTPETVTGAVGVPPQRIRQIARDLAARRPSLVIGGGSAGAHTNGTDALTAVLALNLILGNVGRPGGVLFNPAPPIADLPGTARSDSLPEWQRLTERLRAGSVQALLVKDANPVFGTPSGLRFREALNATPFIASFSSFMDETTAMADIVLPSHLPLEDWGDDVPDPSPGFQVLTVQQPVVRPTYDTRSFWDVLLTLGEELGGAVRTALPWPNFKEMLREGLRPLHAERRGSVREPDFERFWVRLLQQGGWWDEGQTATAAAGASGPGVQRLSSGVPQAQFVGSEQEYPFYLVLFPHNTLGTGESAHLPWMQAAPDPMTTAVWQSWVEVNPGVAQRMGLSEGDIVTVESPQGRIEAPVYVYRAASPNVVAVPLGQGHSEYGRWAKGRGDNPLNLVAASTDQATGALAYGATRVRLVKTGRRMALPKYEGTAEHVQLETVRVLQITRDS